MERRTALKAAAVGVIAVTVLASDSCVRRAIQVVRDQARAAQAKKRARAAAKTSQHAAHETSAKPPKNPPDMNP